MKVPEFLQEGIHRDEQMTCKKGWAVNLAIFRIIFFGLVALPWAVRFYHWAVQTLPNLPDSLWIPISYYRFIPLEVLHAGTFVQALGLANIVAIVLALIGFRTRISTGFAAVFSLYLFGLMENQGKVDHFHHVVWFMAMLAAGETGEMFSVDAVITAIKRADTGEVQTQIPSGHALKILRYIWILLGLLYLGSGLAKLGSALTAGWARTMNLQNILLRRWIELSWYDPNFTLPLRIDRLPHWILEPLGWGAIFFEVCFVFFVLFRLFRPTLAIAGLVFHVGNGVFLGIWFTTLFPVYACLIDWVAMAKKLSRRRNGEPFIIYDGACRICRRTVAILKCFDVYDSLTPIAGLSNDPRREKFSSLTDKMIERDLYWAQGGITLCGYDAYVQIAHDLIFLRPIALFMKFAPVAMVGRLIYRRIADSRRCSLAKVNQPMVAIHHNSRSIHVIGALLIVGQLSLTGCSFVAPHCQRYLQAKQWYSPIAKLVDGISRCKWPFDLYPTFAGITYNKIQIYECRWMLNDGREFVVPPDTYWNTFRNTGLTWVIMSELGQSEVVDHKRAQELDLVKWLWREEKSSFRNSVVAARIYLVRYKLQSSEVSFVSGTDQTLQYSFPASLFMNADKRNGKVGEND